MFFAIGEDVTSIQNLSVEGVGQAAGNGFRIAPITSGGNTPDNYYYFKGLESQFSIPDGWYTTVNAQTLMQAVASGTLDDYRAKVNMARGEGLIVNMGAAGRALRGSGEVLTGDSTIPLNKDYTGVNNPYPVEVGIQDYEILGVTQAAGNGFRIAPITSGGNTPDNYYYFKGLESQFSIPDGWYTTVNAQTLMQAVASGTLNDYRAVYTFKPGESAIVNMGAAGRSLKIKCPIVAK